MPHPPPPQILKYRSSGSDYFWKKSILLEFFGRLVLQELLEDSSRLEFSQKHHPAPMRQLLPWILDSGFHENSMATNKLTSKYVNE